MRIFPVADPYVLKAGNAYYLYAAGRENGVFTVRRSTDLKTWSAEKEIFRAAADAWSLDCYWAPECHVIGGRFCLFYSANQRVNPSGDEETFRISVAVCDTPDGRFEPLYDRPLFDPGYPAIDGNILCEDGRVYLYYSRCCYKHKIGPYEESHIYAVELHSDLSGAVGEPVCILKPEQDWEDRSAPTTGRRWNEGSFIRRHNGRYYILYSANFYQERHYAMGYAVSDSPTGPFVKAAENPIVECFGDVTGTGHGCLVDGPDGMCAVYHGYTPATGPQRVGFVSPARFENGRLVVDYRLAEPMRTEE